MTAYIMRYGHLIAGVLLAMIGAAAALEAPAPGREDARVLFINYDPYEVVKVIGRSRNSTQIIFGATEEIAHVAIGDSIAWEVAPAQNILFLKPRENHPPTNLQVVTILANGERRNYNFELRTSDDDPVVYYSVQFRYPTDEANARALRAERERLTQESSLIDETLTVHQMFGERNFSYSVQGLRTLQPDAVYDDGQVTVMRFAGNRPIPAIYMVREDGQESLVPSDVRNGGQMVVIHTTAREFRLRAGDTVLCVYNEDYDPVGTNPATGTTSPSIQRELATEVRGAER